MNLYQQILMNQSLLRLHKDEKLNLVGKDYITLESNFNKS